MKKKRKHQIIVGFLSTFLIAAGFYFLGADKDNAARLPVEKVIIKSHDGKEHIFDLEVAENDADLENGLMFRKKMPKDHGMIFLLGKEPEETAFWMKDTFIPLDILFITESGVIGYIHPMATPQSLDPISSQIPATAAIELNGGRAEELGIRVGDTVIYRYFSP